MRKVFGSSLCVLRIGIMRLADSFHPEDWLMVIIRASDD